MLERLLMRKDMRLGNIQQKLMIQEKALARLEKKVAEHESLLLFRQFKATSQFFGWLLETNRERLERPVALALWIWGLVVQV